jgi:hypothetical protein
MVYHLVLKKGQDPSRSWNSECCDTEIYTGTDDESSDDELIMQSVTICEYCTNNVYINNTYT